ncbi:MAG: hypothetical protein LBG22_00955 [Treponema sp.]|jgi:hypothetical protein|nr:hypothetical protein [Treponema sp.]
MAGLFLFSSFGLLFAAGRKDNVQKTVDTPEGFTEFIDINNRKKGKHNFFIEAEDKGGNSSMQGPYNIYIDPESDLPIARIVNPREDMRVPGNLNIVGTCADDDGVDHVELVFNDDPAATVIAEGREFWSYFYDTNSLTDKLYSITAYGVDINGLKGRPFRVSWNLDRKKPVTRVNSHDLGALVSGKISLEGIIRDGNGVESLSYSADNSGKFIPLNIRIDAKDKSARYSLSLDTRKYKDGPKVIWFKAGDSQGSEGIYTYLIYVDNTGPDVKIVYPEEKTAQNGVFRTAGYVVDTVGIKSLSWKLGKNTGEFELVTGNPWWTREFDLRGEKGKSIDLEIRAEDLSGNISVARRKISLDQAADLPRVSLTGPASAAVIPGLVVPLTGIASDDDGVESIFYSIDGGDPVEVPCSGLFQISIDNLALGTHSISVWARDIYGVIGPDVDAKNFILAGDRPQISIESAFLGGEKKPGPSMPWISGMELNIDRDPVLVLGITTGSALKAISYRLGAQAPLSETIRDRGGAKFTRNIVLPASIDFGRVPIHIEAEDIHGQTGSLDEILFVTDLSRTRGDPEIVIPDLQPDQSGAIYLNQALSGYLAGARAREYSARLEGETYGISISQEGNYFSIHASSDGRNAYGVQVVMESDKGFEYRSSPMNLLVSESPGRDFITFNTLDGRDWKTGMELEMERGDRRTIVLEAGLQSAYQLQSAVFTAGGREIKASSKKTGDGYTLTVNIPTDLPADRTVLNALVQLKGAPPVRATGEFVITRPLLGRNVNTDPGFLWCDPRYTDGGEIILDQAELLTGLYTGRPVSRVSISGDDSPPAGSGVEENGGMQNSVEGLSVSVDEYGRISLRSQAEGHSDPVKFTITDRDGWTYQTESFRFFTDSIAPRISFADADMEDIWVRDVLPISLIVSDQNDITSIEYSVDMGRNWRRFDLIGDYSGEGGAEFQVAQLLDFGDSEDGLIRVMIRAVDESGKTGNLNFNIHKDTVPPVAALIVPMADSPVNGIIRLGILVEDAGKISSVEYEGTRPEREWIGSEEGAEELGYGFLGTETEIEGEEEGRWAATGQLENFRCSIEPSNFIDVLVGTEEIPLLETMKFHFTDAAGNHSVLDSWPFIIDMETDKPIVEINLPEEGEVIIDDFVISGITYDDDQVGKIWYFIDDNEETVLEADNSYSIPIALSGLTDNEHTVTVIGEDIYGVRGEPVTRKFRVSLEEPKANLLSPGFDEIVTGTVTLSGTAWDKNSINRLQVSLDSGISFDDCIVETSPGQNAGEIETVPGSVTPASAEEGAGEERAEEKIEGREWNYTFNTRILKDGTHVVFYRVWDDYGITGFYSSLINVDNTAPKVLLEYPRDGMTTVGPVLVSGQATDGVGLKDITIDLYSIDGHEVPAEIASVTLEPHSILAYNMDLTRLPDGLYNIDIWAADFANNITHVSRNVMLEKEKQRNFVECLYPLEGEHIQGSFNLYGNAGGTDTPHYVTLMINGVNGDTVEVNQAGYFRFNLDESRLAIGKNTLSVHSDFGGKNIVFSPERTIEYKPSGAWVTIDSLNMGDFAFERPWLSGRAGYSISAEDQAALKNKATHKEDRKAIEEKKLNYVDISFDNGLTFAPAGKIWGKNAGWKYRLETQDMTEGAHYLIVRANMKNGETAVTRTLIQIDKTPPVIRLVAPATGGRYNQRLEYTALLSDDIALKRAGYALRTGDKAAYEIPGFIQGLYFDFHLLGASMYDLGVGLTFFNDNVKLQFQYGQMTQGMYTSSGQQGKIRYGGNILGAKLLANLYTVPFTVFGGPDWSWLSGSIAIGANFSYFDQTQSGNGTILSAMIGQAEFPRVTTLKWKYFRTFSFYTEGQLWFVPTDVSKISIPTVKPLMTFGLRTSVF